MSILDNKNTPNRLDGLTDKLKEEALGKVDETVNKYTGDVVNKIQQVQQKAEEIQDKINQVQQAASKITDVPLKSQLPPNFEITTPEISNIVSYGKSLGETHIVYAHVSIDGQDISKENNLQVEVTQNIASHDDFEILCPSEAFNENNQYPFSKTKQYLGGTATIQLKQFGASQYLFTGIITSITSRRRDGYTYIVLKGNSPTILLDNGKDCQSYEKMNLEQIISNATQEYNNDLLKFDVRPTIKDLFTYTVQYRESDFNFLRRMAIRYGQFFYYNGTNIVFGGYGGQTVEMIEEQDIYEYELKMEVLPQKFSYVSYGGKQAEEYTVNSDNVSVQEPPNPFQFAALKASERVFSKVPTSLFNQSLLENGEMEVREAVKRQREYRKNVFYLQAKSGNPNLKLGDIVKLKAWMPQHETFGKEGVPLESYMVIKLKHYSDGHSYYNEFTAIPHDNTVPPYMDEDDIPLCEEQSATVTDNNDPEGLSRIRVQFPWQKQKNEQTPWLRVTTPYAGNGKGMHVIPEVGEEVLVAFENGNAEKPVVLGAMFNGKGKSGHGGSGNHKKGLQTRSGNKLLMNDNDGSVVLEDHGQSSMKFDGSGNSSIGTSSSQMITVGAKEGSPDGEAKFAMDAGGNITLKANTNITLEVGSNKISINADGTITLNGDKILSTAKTGFGVNGGKSVQIAAENNHITGGPTKIDGGDVFIN